MFIISFGIYTLGAKELNVSTDTQKKVVAFFLNEEYESYQEEIEALYIRKAILDSYRSENTSFFIGLKHIFVNYLKSRKVEDYTPHQVFMNSTLWLNQTKEEKELEQKKWAVNAERSAENNLQNYISVFLEQYDQ